MISNKLILERPKIKKREGKIAIIGSGPAGISIAVDLAKMGFAVTIFEVQKEPGGVLIYRIPEIRLPNEVVRRGIAKLSRFGVEIKTK